ncbi:Na+/H+ antiporter NhaC family protein [Clostridium sp. SHJSY1]|uniref:Na+/H+ antiporter NhaC family protein n=1 Tax=Clostridium sp. SHJSY1 TaxID=2942483 RepID=UPI00287415C3|nr:Na+/H+ antiporter NhaC family protein [Clostridium sp. SHJSY1]MDS0526717.1 Na+/H+ antiporter NhaC family protein [Clostridium sp. SHJSY1]
MLETIILFMFIIGLLICLGFNLPLLYALLFGFIIFFSYGLSKKNTVKHMIQISFKGIKTVKNILIIFLLIGMLTSVWRASGTISFIIYYSTKLIIPEAFILITFILCCMLSILTGTAFGTVATIGVICMTMANSMGLNKVLVGGAILSGIYFGDRCSPMSTSALLISELTKTNIYKNIKLMIKTSVIPFIVTCIIYIIFGFLFKNNSVPLEIRDLFAANFNLHWLTVLPAIIIILLSLLKVNVKITMTMSILIASIVCIFVQKIEFASLFKMFILGYHSSNAEIATMLDGGGIQSMLKVSAIVCLSSSYASIFEETGLLEGIKKYINKLSSTVTPFGSVAITSFLTCMITCNQTLSIILTNQLCNDVLPDDYQRANSLENTAVVVAPLIPWSIAGAVPLATISAPTSCILAACYLYILPLFSFFVFKKKNSIHMPNSYSDLKNINPIS